MKTNCKGILYILTTPLILGLTAPGWAAPATPESPSASAPSSTKGLAFSEWIDGKAPRFIADGKFILNARLRYEYVDQDNRRHSNAPTLRTQFGFQTGSLYGFSGLIEAENIAIIGNQNNYNQAGLNRDAANRAVVADPKGTEINRAWIGYDQYKFVAKVGRQRIVLDDARFIGNVIWRQNEQTYDAASLSYKGIPNTTLYYAYIEEVHRVFGDDSPQGNWDSNSHLFNVSYSPNPKIKITPYVYLLDLDDSPGNSTDTYGISVSGKYPIKNDFSVIYHAEYAHQTDAADNPADFDADFIRAKLGGAYKSYQLIFAYEELGSDSGRQAFRTPLATLHAFNGWADTFLATPPQGLRDYYVSLGGKLPFEFNGTAVYHIFDSDKGDLDFGDELDLVLSRKIGQRWTFLTKYALYNGKDVFVDTTKFWAQLEFAY